MDEFTRDWIIEKGLPIVESYDGNLTIRTLYYRLVAAGMTNSQNHYKRVVAAMKKARWDGRVEFDAFQDHEREVLGETEYEETSVERRLDTASWAIKHYLTTYHKNRWENQPIYPEVFIEKKALQGMFEGPCNKWSVALSPCKGYPSLTFLYAASERFKEVITEGKKPIILYFGDYDPSGEDIPRSIKDNLYEMGADIEVKRIALMKQQVIDWKLPPAPVKKTDSRAANWDGLGQVELDAVEPNQLKDLINLAIEACFNFELHDDLMEMQKTERAEYKTEIRTRIDDILDDE